MVRALPPRDDPPSCTPSTTCGPPTAAPPAPPTRPPSASTTPPSPCRPRCASRWPPRWRPGTQVIVHGIDVDAVRALRAERDAVRAELGIGPDELLAVTVANFRAPKGYPDLFEAARLVDRRGVPVRFVVIGQGPLEDDLRRPPRLARPRLATADPRATGPTRPASPPPPTCSCWPRTTRDSRWRSWRRWPPACRWWPPTSAAWPRRSHDGESGRLVPARRPDLLAEAIVELAGDPTSGPAWARGRRRPPSRFSARRSELEIEDVYRRASTAAARQVGHGRARRPR